MSNKTEVFQYTITGMSELSNQVKDVFLSNMLKQNIITNSQYEEMIKYSVIAAEEKMLGNIWKKLWSKDKTTTKLVVVKVIQEIEEES